MKSGKVLCEQAGGIEKRFVKELNGIGSKALSFKPAETLRSFLISPEREHLFTFLRIPGVPPTNNHAEQSLRKIVIMGKVCFGMRSKNGIKTHSILLHWFRQHDGKESILGSFFIPSIPPTRRQRKLRCTKTPVERISQSNLLEKDDSILRSK